MRAAGVAGCRDRLYINFGQIAGVDVRTLVLIGRGRLLVQVGILRDRPFHFDLLTDEVFQLIAVAGESIRMLRRAHALLIDVSGGIAAGGADRLRRLVYLRQDVSCGEPTLFLNASGQVDRRAFVPTRLAGARTITVLVARSRAHG